MKEQTIYIAYDGKQFTSKEECVVYETISQHDAEMKALDKELNKINHELERQNNVITFAQAWIQVRKSKRDPFLADSVFLSLDRIRSTETFSTIEELYKEAKKKFNESLNASTPNLKVRAEKIYKASLLLTTVIERRDELLRCYYEYRKHIDDARKRIKKLKESKAKILERIDNIIGVSK